MAPSWQSLGLLLANVFLYINHLRGEMKHSKVMFQYNVPGVPDITKHRKVFKTDSINILITHLHQ